MEIHALIVDDEAYCAERLAKDMDWKTLGVSKIYTAYSANQAIKIITSESIQLMICDIEMPGSSGLDLIEWINEGSRLMNYTIECLILTCHPEYEYMRKAMQLGCSDYLLKPFKKDDMEKTLRLLIQKIKDSNLTEADLNKSKDERHFEIGSDSDSEISSDTNEYIRHKVIPYIQENIATQMTVSEIAEVVNLNPQYLMRLFRKQIGCSIVQYVTKYKMELAKDMLIHSKISNADISEKLGYLNTSYFLRVFKENERMTPGAFRKKYNIY